MTSKELLDAVSRIRLLLAVFVIAGCEANDTRLYADTAIHNVSIIDVSDGKTIDGKAVLVLDGRISDIVSDDRLDDYAPKKVIDGGGNFVIPALADVHVHIQSPAELQNYVRYGVGLVVNMSGGPQILDMREAVASNELLGPSIVSVGPTLDGDPPTNPLFTTIDPDNAEDVVEWIGEQGYDAVKIYQQLDANSLSAVVSSASARGLITTGHVSREIGIEQALDAGQRYIAHGEELAFESFDESTRTYDQGAIPKLADRLSQAGVTVTPMLAYLENIPRQVSDLQSYLDTEEMQLVPAATRSSFDQRQGWFANRENPVAFTEQIESLADFVAALTVELQDRAVPLILGTDAGFGGAIPGYSVHEELEALVDAGLTEMAALQSATSVSGEFLSQIDPTRAPWGLVRPGYTASLLLIGADPIEDISATQEILGVMIDGEWISEDELSRMEADLSERQRAMLPMARAFEDALVDGDIEAATAAIGSIPAEYAGEPLISADSCIFLGYRHYYGGNRPLAGRLYALCAEMHPKSSPLWIHIAVALESDNDIDAALQAYRRALDLNPWYGNPRLAIDRLSNGSSEPID